MPHRRLSFAVLAASVLAVAACSDVSAPVAPGSDAAQLLAKGGTTTGGGGGGGGGTTTTTFDPYSILPTTSPSPDYILRESFGLGPNFVRPAGGKGDPRSTAQSPALNGFWLEYPGSKNATWLTSETGQRWIMGGAGSGRDTTELPSPLQIPDVTTGMAWSDFLFEYQGQAPTALLPVTVALPNAGYELSASGFPGWYVPGAYLAIGFTDSNLLYSNLTSSGSLWVKITDQFDTGVNYRYDLWQGPEGTGTLIASGMAEGSGRDFVNGRYSLRYSPAAQTVTLSVGPSVIGTFPAKMGTPKYIAFEGVGAIDNLVLRK